jgi:hypothetical protein
MHLGPSSILFLLINLIRWKISVPLCVLLPLLCHFCDMLRLRRQKMMYKDQIMIPLKLLIFEGVKRDWLIVNFSTFLRQICWNFSLLLSVYSIQYI